MQTQSLKKDIMSYPQSAGLVYACLVSQEQKILAEAGNKTSLKSTLTAFINGIASDPRLVFISFFRRLR